jgi:hypothetical protein
MSKNPKVKAGFYIYIVSKPSFCFRCIFTVFNSSAAAMESCTYCVLFPPPKSALGFNEWKAWSKGRLWHIHIVSEPSLVLSLHRPSLQFLPCTGDSTFCLPGNLCARDWALWQKCSQPAVPYTSKTHCLLTDIHTRLLRLLGLKLVCKSRLPRMGLSLFAVAVKLCQA